MKNVDLWKPSRIRFDNKTKRFVLNYPMIYAGSRHISEIQFAHYLPLFLKYCSGRMLDCGSGPAPYFELLKNQVSKHYCIDWIENPDVRIILDEIVDMNQPFDLAVRDFDCVLLSDVFAHIQHPSQLIHSLSQHLKRDGVFVLTTPFVAWIAAPPHEYYHPTEFALRSICKDASLEIIHVEPYGGYPDVLLDTLNKGMTGRFGNRFFRLLASVVKKTSWYKKTNEKTKYSYPIGYTLVARKL